MIAWCYRVLTILAGPIVPLLLHRRARRGKEVPSRRGERLGRPGLPRPAGRLIWMHGASVGESLSMLILIDALLERDRTLGILVTTQTVTGARMMAERLPERAFHQFVPIDRPGYVRRFLDHWRPDAVLWVESELWPNMLDAVRRRGIPAALINARMSERSARRWHRSGGFFRQIMATFALVQPSGARTAALLRDLGIDSSGPVGNLKYAARPPAADAEALANLRASIGTRPLWLAASTHPGEEDVCLAAHARICRDHPDALLIVIPRHPERGADVAALAAARGLPARRRQEGAVPNPGDAVYIADTLGELGLFYRASRLAFVGGSLSPIGGHNPIEPALLDCAVLTGPHVDSFEDVYAALMADEAARTITCVTTLGDAVSDLLARPEAATAMAARAKAVAERHRDILGHVMTSLMPVLPGTGER